jgi:hypothetical protein
MFRHLDDPTPPEPTDLGVERVVAEGARRVRRRRVLAGSTAAVLLAVGVAGIAGRLPGMESSDKVEMPSDTSEPDRPAVTSSSTTSTSSSSTTTTTTPSGPGLTTPGPDEGGDVFAALVKKPGEDRILVVLANARFGEIDRTLADIPMPDRGAGCCIAFSPDRRYVYLTAAAGTFADDVDTIYRLPTFQQSSTGNEHFEEVAAGTGPVISPDGRTLLFRESGATQAALVVRDLATGNQRRLPVSGEDVVTSYGFTAANAVVVGIAPGGEVTTLYELADGATSLTGGREIGPPAGAPAGTSWDVSGLHPTTGRLAVQQTCCSIGDQDPATLLYVDPATGEVDDTVDLPSRDQDVEVSPEGTRELILVPPPDSPGAKTLRLHDHETDKTTTIPIPDVLAIDW